LKALIFCVAGVMLVVLCEPVPGAPAMEPNFVDARAKKARKETRNSGHFSGDDSNQKCGFSQKIRPAATRLQRHSKGSLRQTESGLGGRMTASGNLSSNGWC
jgi:hypothetical protein